MDNVQITGELPPVGAEAVRLVERSAEVRVGRAVQITNDEIERRQRGGPGRMSAPDVTSTGDEVAGESFPTDFRWRFLNFGTGAYNRKRNAPIGPKRGRRSRSGRRGALKLASGEVVAQVQGIRPRNFIQAGKKAAQTRAEAELEATGDDFAEAVTRR